MMFKIVNRLTPKYLQEIFCQNACSRLYCLRQPALNFDLPACKTDYYKNSFAFTGAKLWNLLPNELKFITSVNVFKNKLKFCNLHQLISEKIYVNYIFVSIYVYILGTYLFSLLTGRPTVEIDVTTVIR